MAAGKMVGQPSIPAPSPSAAMMAAQKAMMAPNFGVRREPEWTDVPSAKGYIQVFDMRAETDERKAMIKGRVVSMLMTEGDRTDIVINIASGYEIHLSAEVSDEIIKALTTKKLKET